MFVKKIIFFLMLVLSLNPAQAVEIQDDSDAILKLSRTDGIVR